MKFNADARLQHCWTLEFYQLSEIGPILKSSASRALSGKQELLTSYLSSFSCSKLY